MSPGETPASENARGPDQRAPVYVRSIRPLSRCLGASPWPMIFTFGRFTWRATSGLATMTAPPPSVTTQQSSRCSGSLSIGEASTSSTLTGFGSNACGLYWACSDAATLTQASCSLVVPNSYMCRCAASAYIPSVLVPYTSSNDVSGLVLADRGACSLRGRFASVTSATLHLPSAIAAAACPM